MKKTLMFTAAACALLMLASCGGKKNDAKAEYHAFLEQLAAENSASDDKSAGKTQLDEAKGVAKDAASAFTDIVKQLEGGDTAAALASIEAAIPLLKKEKTAPESLFRYELTKDGSGVRILGPADGATFGGTLVFPSTIEGMPVKEIYKMASSHNNNKSLDEVSSLIVPEGVTYFGGFASKALVYVSLPSTINRLWVLDDYSWGFGGCSKLARIDIPENAPLAAIPDWFAPGTSLAQFKFPSALEGIGDYAFKETKLTSVELPAGLQVIGAYAFEDCGNLTEVIVPEGMGKVHWQVPTERDALRPRGAFKGTHLNLKSQAAVKAIGYEDKF